MASIYNFKIEGIDGETIDFAQFRGKKMMLVNVASECGYTHQYQQMQELHEEMKDKVVLIGFPSNDFGAQEPGTNQDIQQFCTAKYGVTFHLTTKVSILGDDIHPIYRWLTQRKLNGKFDSEVKWNFHKYLVDEAGNLFQTFPSAQSPISEEILDWILA